MIWNLEVFCYIPKRYEEKDRWGFERAGLLYVFLIWMFLRIIWPSWNLPEFDKIIPKMMFCFVKNYAPHIEYWFFRHYVNKNGYLRTCSDAIKEFKKYMKFYRRREDFHRKWAMGERFNIRRKVTVNVISARLF